MAAFKSPQLLPIPLIVAMVVVLVLPVLAWTMVYSAKEKEKKELDKKYAQEEAQIKERLLAIEKTADNVVDKDRFELATRQFNLRFLKNVEEAEAFYNGVFWAKGDGRRDYNFQKLETSETAETRRDGHIPGYPQEYVREFALTATPKGMAAFIQDCYQMTHRVYYPKASSIRCTLPRGVEPKEEEKAFLKPFSWALANPNPDRTGFFFELDKAASDEAGQGVFIGTLWYFGFEMADDVFNDAVSQAVDKRWKDTLTFLRGNMGKPCVQVYNGSPEPALDAQTGLKRILHPYPVFFYFDYFRIQPDPDIFATKHHVYCRIVFPLTERTK